MSQILKGARPTVAIEYNVVAFCEASDIEYTRFDLYTLRVPNRSPIPHFRNISISQDSLTISRGPGTPSSGQFWGFTGSGPA